jgi:hypothetical protein
MTVPPRRADLEYRIWPTEQLALRILRLASDSRLPASFGTRQAVSQE